MLRESPEALCDVPAAGLYDLCDDRSGVVEPDLGRDPADVLKERFQSLQEAFKVLSVVQLQVAAIAVGKAEDKVFGLLVKLAVLNEVGITEIRLGFAGWWISGR